MMRRIAATAAVRPTCGALQPTTTAAKRGLQLTPIDVSESEARRRVITGEGYGGPLGAACCLGLAAIILSLKNKKPSHEYGLTYWIYRVLCIAGNTTYKKKQTEL